VGPDRFARPEALTGDFALSMTSFQDLRKESAWPPTRNGMPDLGAEYPDTLLAQYIAASESLEGDFHPLAANLARLADKAVREYRAASHCLTGFVETPSGVESIEGHTLLLRATDHVENCIDAVRRAEGFFATPAFKGVTTQDNREMLKTLHKGVHDIRNSIQHADERFAQGRILEGEPLFPAMTSDCVYFAGEYLVYGEIAARVIIVWEMGAAGVSAVTSD
jgi:hypothetical protein